MGIWKELLDFIFPPSCVLCGENGTHPLCRSCMEKIEIDPICSTKMGVTVTSFSKYEDTTRALLARFKYDFQEQVGTIIADLITPYLSTLSPRILVPVPLHFIKIRQRGFNQSAIIAKRLSKNLGWKYAPRLIIRQRNTKPQFELDDEERLANVEKAFARYPFGAIQPNQPYMLIDDIVTTGATLASCAKTLKESGATRIEGLTFARARNVN
ncbi:ComF family protein [bacterium]|nr:ComF family protein [bacterium]